MQKIFSRTHRCFIRLEERDRNSSYHFLGKFNQFSCKRNSVIPSVKIETDNFELAKFFWVYFVAVEFGRTKMKKVNSMFLSQFKLFFEQYYRTFFPIKASIDKFLAVKGHSVVDYFCSLSLHGKHDGTMMRKNTNGDAFPPNWNR